MTAPNQLSAWLRLLLSVSFSFPFLISNAQCPSVENLRVEEGGYYLYIRWDTLPDEAIQVGYATDGDNVHKRLLHFNEENPFIYRRREHLHGEKEVSRNTKEKLEYYYVRRVCGDKDKATYSEWKQVTTFPESYIAADCDVDPTTFEIEDLWSTGFKLKVKPYRDLDVQGRRFFVRAEPIDGGATVEQLIFNEQDLHFENLAPGTRYKVYVKEVRGGQGTVYYSRCPEPEPLLVQTPSLEELCNAVSAPKIDCIGSDGVRFLLRDTASYDSVRYLVEFGSTKGPVPAQVQYIFNGESAWVGGLSPDTEYGIRYASVLSGRGVVSEFQCPMKVLQNVKTKSKKNGLISDCATENTATAAVDLPEIFTELQPKCGKKPSKATESSKNPKATAKTGEVWTIQNFPLLLTNVRSNNGRFSGEGIVALPFGEKALVEVEFSNIEVNETGEVLTGQVFGKRRPIEDLLDLTTQNLTYENYFDTPKQVGFWDGLWSETGQPYDDRGFDKKQRYAAPPKLSEIPYQPFIIEQNPLGIRQWEADKEMVFADGSPRLKLDSDGNPNRTEAATEYLWLERKTKYEKGKVFEVGDPITTAGTLVWTQFRSDYVERLQKNIGQLKSDYTKEEKTNKTHCDAIRDSMAAVFGDMGYDSLDRPFIFGPDDIWYVEGMHKEFERRPTELGLKSGRPETEVELERLHVGLFECDVALFEKRFAIELLEDMEANPKRFDYAAQQIKSKMIRLPYSVAMPLMEAENMDNWLLTMLDSIAEAQAGYGHIFDIDLQGAAPEPIVPHSSYDAAKNAVSMMASLDGFLPQNIDNEQLVKISYEQGWDWLPDGHRAFLLEKLVNKLVPNAEKGTTQKLPFPIRNEVSGRPHTVFLDNLMLSPDSAFADFHTIVEAVPSPARLVFSKKKVPLWAAGFEADVQLALAASHEFVPLSPIVGLDIYQDSNSYVRMDCNGFAGISLKGRIQLNKNNLYVVQNGTNQAVRWGGAVYEIPFQQSFDDWGSAVLKTSDFEHQFTTDAALGLIWDFSELVVDFSDVENPDFPKKSKTDALADKHWQGLAFLNGEVRLSFLKNETGESPSIEVPFAFFNERGLNVDVETEKVANLCDFKLNSHACSVDNLSLHIRDGQIQQGGFSGEMGLSFLKKTGKKCDSPGNALAYRASFLGEDNLQFALEANEANFEFLPTASTMRIGEGSSVFLGRKNYGEVMRLSTNLHGSLDMDNKDNKLKVNNLAFKNLKIVENFPALRWGMSKAEPQSISLDGKAQNLADVRMRFDADSQTIVQFFTNHLADDGQAIGHLIELKTQGNYGQNGQIEWSAPVWTFHKKQQRDAGQFLSIINNTKPRLSSQFVQEAPFLKAYKIHGHKELLAIDTRFGLEPKSFFADKKSMTYDVFPHEGDTLGFGLFHPRASLTLPNKCFPFSDYEVFGYTAKDRGSLHGTNYRAEPSIFNAPRELKLLYFPSDTALKEIVFQYDQRAPESKRFRKKITVPVQVSKSSAWAADDFILSAYPFDGMLNFYPDEWSQHKGYLQLKDLPYALPPLDSPNVQVIVRFTCEDGRTLESEAKYNKEEQRLTYDMPFAFFKTEKRYLADFVVIIQYKKQYGKETAQWSDVSFLSDSLTFIASTEEHLFYNIQFRTSRYRSFSEKLEAADLKLVYDENDMLKLHFKSDEPFDAAELWGTKSQPALVSCRIQREEKFWLYQQYDLILMASTFEADLLHSKFYTRRGYYQEGGSYDFFNDFSRIEGYEPILAAESGQRSAWPQWLFDFQQSDANSPIAEAIFSFDFMHRLRKKWSEAKATLLSEQMDMAGKSALQKDFVEDVLSDWTTEGFKPLEKRMLETEFPSPSEDSQLSIEVTYHTPGYIKPEYQQLKRATTRKTKQLKLSKL